MPPFLSTTDLFRRADNTAKRNTDLIKTAPVPNEPKNKPCIKNLFK